MHTCPLLRASMESRKSVARRISRTRASTSARYRMAIRASLAGLTGWQALRDVLNAIPDSNDDFGLF
ncbi:hypothetical protein [Paraburkholderia caffeinilytica]|uniref:hypothetical protein n=1 Tax=Paraburkholderia caffeinilytica TaxID=1761016 RepID=UPI0038BE0B50